MIKRKRKIKGITQKKLASSLGVSKSLISKIERHPEDCNPNIKFIINLSNLLDIHHINVYLYFYNKISNNKK